MIEKNRPLFSVITVNLNNAAGLRRTIDSLDHQTLTDWEHIIQDGGSADHSLRVLNHDKNPKRQFESTLDGGIYQGMNLAMLRATGHLVWFLNSGDVFFHTSVLQTVKESWERFGWRWSRGGIIFDQSSLVGTTKSMPEIIERRKVLKGTQYYPHPSCIYEKSLLIEIGSYRPTFGIGADQELSLRAESVEPPHFIPKILAIFEPAGASGGYTPVQLELMFRRIRKESREYFGGNILLDALWLIGRVFYRHAAILGKACTRWR
jgi:glycosyltransferase involved in cell wall biosynthesis